MCKKVTRLVPYLEPEEECMLVPREVREGDRQRIKNINNDKDKCKDNDKDNEKDKATYNSLLTSNLRRSVC